MNTVDPQASSWTLEQRHAVLIQTLKEIESLADAPHWDADRRWQIANKANWALAQDWMKAEDRPLVTD